MIDKNDLNKILCLDDDVLKSKLLEITQLIGAENSKVSATISDVDKLKKTVSSLSNKDIERIVASFGQENVDKIQKIISGK